MKKKKKWGLRKLGVGNFENLHKCIQVYALVVFNFMCRFIFACRLNFLFIISKLPTVKIFFFLHNNTKFFLRNNTNTFFVCLFTPGLVFIYFHYSRRAHVRKTLIIQSHWNFTVGSFSNFKPVCVQYDEVFSRRLVPRN